MHPKFDPTGLVGFELMTSRSCQYISCRWDTCSKYSPISDFSHTHIDPVGTANWPSVITRLNACFTWACVWSEKETSKMTFMVQMSIIETPAISPHGCWRWWYCPHHCVTQQSAITISRWATLTYYYHPVRCLLSDPSLTFHNNKSTLTTSVWRSACLTILLGSIRKSWVCVV